LEVGPGLGVLTRELVKRVARVIAVEKDERFIGLLDKRDLEINSGLQIINGDILRFNLEKYISGPYKVVANIPYYLTSKLFQYFLERENKPTELILMVQKEVGERVVAKPGNLSVLGISVQIQADAEILFDVSKESFWPTPEVDSVILKIVPRNKFPQIDDRKLFFRIVKQAFVGKRKQIKNTIRNIESLRLAGIDPKARPQELSIEQWIKLYKLIADSDKDKNNLLPELVEG
jgi:16S rRNA (adenine1518-N6/adenine1519-N6)-dimethyltransferase